MQRPETRLRRKPLCVSQFGFTKVILKLFRLPLLFRSAILRFYILSECVCVCVCMHALVCIIFNISSRVPLCGFVTKQGGGKKPGSTPSLTSCSCVCLLMRFSQRFEATTEANAQSVLGLYARPLSPFRFAGGETRRQEVARSDAPRLIKYFNQRLHISAFIR